MCTTLDSVIFDHLTVHLVVIRWLALWQLHHWKWWETKVLLKGTFLAYKKFYYFVRWSSTSISCWWYFLLNLLLNCRAAKLGQEFRDQLQKIQQKFPQIIKEVRGRGLLNAVDLNNDALSPASAYDICIKLKERGILAKPTHDTIIRLAPPLSIRYIPFTNVPSYLAPQFVHTFSCATSTIICPVNVNWLQADIEMVRFSVMRSLQKHQRRSVMCWRLTCHRCRSRSRSQNQRQRSQSVTDAAGTCTDERFPAMPRSIDSCIFTTDSQ